MFKRIRWASLGALAGAAGSVWARRRVKRTVERYVPEEVARKVRRNVTGTVDDLRDAVAEGRRGMAEREAELRSQLPGLAPPWDGGRRELPAADTHQVIELQPASPPPPGPRSRKQSGRRPDRRS